MIDRTTLGEYFYDITSARLLPAPQPMFIYAALFKSALSAALDLGDESMGGELPTAGASEDHERDALMMNEDPIFTSAITVVPELGSAPGHTVRLNRPVFADTTYTEASRQVNGDITSTPINVGSEQVPITIKEFAGPYDSALARVAPYGISAFDAQMAVIPLSRKVGAQLKRDMDKFIDSALVTLLNDGASTVRPTGFTADNDHATSSHGTMDFETLAKAERTLQDLHVPTFDNGQYACVLKPKQLEDLKSDPTFRSLSESNPPINPVLRKNYVGSVGGLDIFKSATLTTTANSSSVDIFTGHVFGPGVIGAGVGRLPRVVAHDDTNYRRFHKVIWTMDAGWTLLDNRFVASVKTA